MESLFLLVNGVTVVALLLSIIYTAGVVWRVEMKLDASYKFFLAAVIFLLLAEVLDIYYSPESALKLALAVKGLRMLFAVLFLIGVFYMRDIIRCMDGEKDRKA